MKKILFFLTLSLLTTAAIFAQTLRVSGEPGGIGTYTSSAKVGMDTSSPSDRLHSTGGGLRIKGMYQAACFILSNGSTYITMDANGLGNVLLGQNTSSTTSLFYIDHSLSSGKDFVNTQSGFLGIDTNSSEKKLAVITPQNGVTVFESTNTNSFFSIKNGNSGNACFDRVTNYKKVNYMWITSNELESFVCTYAVFTKPYPDYPIYFEKDHALRVFNAGGTRPILNYNNLDRPTILSCPVPSRKTHIIPDKALG